MIKDNKKILNAVTKILSVMLIGYAMALRNVTTSKQRGGKQRGGLAGIDVTEAGITTVTNIARDLIEGIVPIVDKTITNTVTGEYARMNPEEASRKLNDMLARQTEFLDRISNLSLIHI